MDIGETEFSIKLDSDKLRSTAYVGVGVFLWSAVSAVFLFSHYGERWKNEMPFFLVGFYVFSTLLVAATGCFAFFARRQMRFFFQCRDQCFSGKDDWLRFLDFYELNVNHVRHWELVRTFSGRSISTHIVLEHDGEVVRSERAKMYEQGLPRGLVESRAKAVIIATSLLEDEAEQTFEKLVKFLRARVKEEPHFSFSLLTP